MKVRVVYFPMEDKFSIWDENDRLVKEWFDTKEEAEKWIIENNYERYK